MDAVFYVTFYPNSGGVHHAAFYVDHLTVPWESIAERLSARSQELEDICVDLDWTMGVSVVDSLGCICHDTGYEVYEELMQMWRQTFCEVSPNCVLGPVCSVDAHTMNITEILQITKTAYEQQQAQRLRERLNTHVNTTLVASHKKM